MSNYQHVFLAEANELLTDLENQLLELEEHPNEMEIIGQIFRALHTIKGSGAMFGFDKVSAFTHNLENVFDLVRNGQLSVTSELVNLSLKSRDYIHRLLENSDPNNMELESEGAQLSLLIQKFLPNSANENVTNDQTIAPVPNVGNPANNGHKVYYISFAPFPDLFKMGSNATLLLDELTEMGQICVAANCDNVPALEKIDPELCYTKWDILLNTDRDINAIRDVFMFVEDIANLVVHELDEYNVDGPTTLENMLKDIIKSGSGDKGQILDVLGPYKKAAAPVVQTSNAAAASAPVNGATLRVASGKLDSLVDLVGEFVTMQAHFAQLAKNGTDADTILLSEQMERLTNELRDNVMGLRMQPIGTVFGKFRRMVRDLSVELNKNVVLTTDGEKTELDKSIIEKLNDPVMHIIRNSIDHGIEPPEKRKQKGKPEHGTINLSASHSGANVVVKISDDGGGLNKQAILNKAVAQSLVTADQELTDQDIYNLIFQPGFSTAADVTKVSGRGVGMDVVKKTITALGGNIVIDSDPETGTEISLVLPLTLAIIEGLLVSIQDEYFIIPLSLVDECVEMEREKTEFIKGRHLINVRDELVPYLELQDYFEIQGNNQKSGQVVIANINSSKFGFVVDRVIASYQTVIKSLGKMYKKVEGISGATILGDGSVALILDIIKLEQAARKMADDKFNV